MSDTTTTEIVGDTGHLRFVSSPNNQGLAPTFLSGSFNPSPDERRVITLFLNFDIGNIGDPSDDSNLRLRFEFTDPLLATVDTLGHPVYLTAEDRITPFREAKGKSPVQQQEES
jgi:hypothetical protein